MDIRGYKVSQIISSDSSHANVIYAAVFSGMLFSHAIPGGIPMQAGAQFQAIPALNYRTKWVGNENTCVPGHHKSVAKHRTLPAQSGQGQG